MNVTSKPKKVPKLPLKSLPLLSEHVKVPSTPEWSAVKNISASDIQEYENKASSQKDQPHKRPWALSGFSDEEEDLDFDMVVKNPIMIRKEPTTSSDQNPAENGNGISKSNKNTGQLDVDLITGGLSSKEIGKIIKRRCSVQLRRVPLDDYVDTYSPEIAKSTKSHGNKKNIDDNKKSSSRATKRPADDRNGPTRPKRMAKLAESPIEPRRLRDRDVPMAESSKRKNIADNNHENDEPVTKVKRTRGKAAQIESSVVMPQRRSARSKTQDEKVSSSVSILVQFGYMLYILYIIRAFLFFRLKPSNEHYDHET